MPQKTRRRSSRPRRKFHYLAPDRVIDLAYLYHTRRWCREVVGIPNTIAEIEIAKLESYTAESGSEDDAFLMAVRAIVVSVGNGIFNRKRACEAEKEAAAREEQEMYQLLNHSRTQSAIIKVLMRVGMIGIFAFFGYQLSKVLGVYVPDEIANETGKTGPSVAMGLIFAGLSTWFSLWWTSLNQKSVTRQYHYRCQMAEIVYEEGKLREQEVQRADLMFLWQTYTGQKYAVPNGFIEAIRGDLADKKARLEEIRPTPFHRTAWRFVVRKLRLKRRSGNGTVHVEGDIAFNGSPSR